MKHIKKFDTYEDYQSYVNSGNFIQPNVSKCINTNETYCTMLNTTYKITYDPYNGHDYVDLGLPSGTKWATMNVGANSETDYGNYYLYGKGAAQYAETNGQSDYTGTYTGTEDPLATTADTVVQVWGGSWHMPTKDQFKELTANTTYTWETNFNGSGINGGKFRAQNGSGNYIFIPATGYWSDGIQSSVGGGGLYWSSTPYDRRNAYYLVFNNTGTSVSEINRYVGFSVRGVVD